MLTRRLPCAFILSTLTPLLLASPTGCDTSCPAIALLSQAHLTLHLPPQKDVTAPETITACQQPTCVSGSLPPVGPEGTLASFNFSTSGPGGALSPDVFGTLGVRAGSVRVVQIRWDLRDVKPSDPRHHYNVEVKDASGATTGQLSGGIVYAHTSNEGCGSDGWTGSLSD